MLSAGSYVLGIALLAILVLSLGFSTVRLRRRLLPEWEGAPARLVEAVVAIALLIWLAELLGVLGLLYAWTLVASALLLAGAIVLGVRAVAPAGGVGGGGSRTPPPAAPPSPRDRTRGPATVAPSALALLVAVGVVALVFAHWGLTAKDALDRGIFNFDSLWYHMPFAAEIAKSHSVTGLLYTESVYVNWAFPQNSELLHAVGVLLAERDTLSLFLNFGWLALAFLAAYCIGSPYGRGPLTVIAAGVLLECHTLVVREPGAAKNDAMVAALLLAAIAVIVNAWAMRRDGDAGNSLEPGWPLAVAGLATGLAVGTKLNALAMAAALTVAVVALAPAGRRRAAAGWWAVAGLAGGGFWYVRNLIAAGNPLPQIESIGPISLPHPERLQTGRPDFNIAHYATDTGIWREYFGPGLDHALGALWPLVLGGAVVGAVAALISGTRVLRWMGGVALFGLLAYVFTPFSAAGADGDPVGFAINIRYALPALLVGLTLLPVALVMARASRASRGEGTRSRSAWSLADWVLLAGLLLVLLATNRADAVARDPDRAFAWAIALLFVLVPAALIFARSRGLSRGAVATGVAALALLVAAIGYPIQRDYLEGRFRNADPDTSIPGMHLDSAYRWARNVEDASIGLAGTTAGYLGYGFYGTDLSNRVEYLGAEGPHGAFNAIPTCREFRAAVNAAELDYLVTAPFLNFIETDEPIASPEAGWLRGDHALTQVDRSGPVTVWRVRGRLDPGACGRRNAPLRYVPQQPG